MTGLGPGAPSSFLCQDSQPSLKEARCQSRSVNLDISQDLFASDASILIDNGEDDLFHQSYKEEDSHSFVFDESVVAASSKLCVNLVNQDNPIVGHLSDATRISNNHSVLQCLPLPLLTSDSHQQERILHLHTAGNAINLQHSIYLVHTTLRLILLSPEHVFWSRQFHCTHFPVSHCFLTPDINDTFMMTLLEESCDMDQENDVSHHLILSTFKFVNRCMTDSVSRLLTTVSSPVRPQPAVPIFTEMTSLNVPPSSAFCLAYTTKRKDFVEACLHLFHSLPLPSESYQRRLTFPDEAVVQLLHIEEAPEGLIVMVTKSLQEYSFKLRLIQCRTGAVQTAVAFRQIFSTFLIGHAVYLASADILFSVLITTQDGNKALQLAKISPHGQSYLLKALDFPSQFSPPCEDFPSPSTVFCLSSDLEHILVWSSQKCLTIEADFGANKLHVSPVTSDNEMCVFPVLSHVLPVSSSKYPPICFHVFPEDKSVLYIYNNA